MVEGARLESEYTPKAYRGFESLPLRHFCGIMAQAHQNVALHRLAGTSVDAQGRIVSTDRLGGISSDPSLALAFCPEGVGGGALGSSSSPALG